MQHGRRHEPDEDGHRRARARDLQQREGGQRQRHEVGEDLHARNSIDATHFVLCTPGSAGTMIARRVAVVGREVLAVDLQRQQRVAGEHLAAVERRLVEDAARLQRAHERRAGSGSPAVRASSREPHAGPLLRGRPALHARDRERRGVLGHGEQLVAAEQRPRGPRRAASARTTAPVISSVIPAPTADLLTGKSPGADLAPRGEQRRPAQRAADRLADVRHQQRQRARRR